MTKKSNYGQWTQCNVYICLTVELYTWNSLDFVYQCHHNKTFLNKNGNVVNTNINCFTPEMCQLYPNWKQTNKQTNRVTCQINTCNIPRIEYLGIHRLSNGNYLIISQKSVPVLTEWEAAETKSLKQQASQSWKLGFMSLAYMQGPSPKNPVIGKFCHSPGLCELHSSPGGSLSSSLLLQSTPNTSFCNGAFWYQCSTSVY